MLNPIEARYYIDNLVFIAENPDFSPKDKLLAMDNVFFSVVHILTEKREKQIFAGVFAKINFICQVYDLGQSWEEKLQALRYWLKRNAAQRSFVPTQGQVAAALQIITELIDICQNAEDKIAVPEALKVWYKGKELPSLVQKHKPEKLIAQLPCVFLAREEATEQQDRKQVKLWCQTENMGKVSIIVQDIVIRSAGRAIKHFKLADVCLWFRPYQNLLFTQIEMLSEDLLHTTDNTLVIIEPDYLIDASQIARCFTAEGVWPYLYLLDKLSFFQGNKYTLEGNLANEMLDELISNPDTNFGQAFKRALSKHSLMAAQFGEEVLQSLHTQLKPQFDNIQKALQSFKNQSLTTEPTFLSAQYGLQGRLDILAQDRQKTQRKDIIELKSSKSFPQIMANYYDQIQVACYNLLVESTFAERSGISAILYSKDMKNPLRDCGKLNFEKLEACLLRNRIVAIDFSLAHKPRKILDNLHKYLSKTPEYKQREAKIFDSYWQKATPLQKAYFEELFSLVMRERIVAKIGSVSQTDYIEGFANLWKRTYDEKLANFILLPHLTFITFEAQKSVLKLQITHWQANAFRENDIVVLYPMEQEQELNPLKYPLLKGNITKLTKNEVHLKLWSQQVDVSFLKEFPFWAIEPLLLERNFDNLIASLVLFLKADLSQKDKILGLQRPTFAPTDALNSFVTALQNTLSPEQTHILQQALSAQDYFLLQGPPGTGKTSKMLKYMLQYLFEHTQEVVVLLAFTNRATAEITDKVREVCGDYFIRLGNSEQEGNFEENMLQQGKSLQNIRQHFQQTRIFVSTVSSFFNNMRYVPTFDTLIVDEASQLTEPYLCGILPKFKRFILIGDEKQLPAVVTQPPEFCLTDNPLLHAIHLKDTSMAIFERLLLNAQEKQWHECYAMLSTQYRTHQDIANFISQEFYKTLRIGSPRQAAEWQVFSPKSTDSIERQLAQSRMIFIPSPPERQAKLHKVEAERVARLLHTIKRVYGDKFNANTVGIITPYKAQIAEILKHIPMEWQDQVTVDTVERYQGSEREIIIISMAVNHEAQLRNLQMLDQTKSVDRKLNVALSRACEQLILLGNPDILQKSSFYQKLLAYIPYHVVWQAN